MPLSDEQRAEGWIHSDERLIPAQNLPGTRTDEFLEWLFSDIARRPPELNLREGAAAARYLKALAWRSPAGPDRALLDRLADVIWGTILRVAPFQISTTQAAIRFLRTYASTYLVWFDVSRAVEFIKASPPPRSPEELFQAPTLESKGISRQGARHPHLMDDLSERIYAAYYVIRRSGVYDARGRIAGALNQQGVPVQVRKRADEHWGAYEVYERVKQHEARLKRKEKATFDVQRWREQAVNKWLYLFLSSRPKR